MGLRPHLFSAEIATFPIQLAITSISMQGTNLVLSASVPPGIDKVTLETRSTLNLPWEDGEQKSVSEGGGEMIFVFPQPPEVARFFRLRANPFPPASHLVSGGALPRPPPAFSGDLEYVATPSLAAKVLDGNAVFHFKGRVDGSDKILITHDGALWDHVNWQWPAEPVAINNTQWNPAEKNYLATTGPAKFLPESFSLESVDLDVIKGRDIVALERTNNGLIVYLDDTPPGAGEYDFNINFHPVGPKYPDVRPSAVARLKISAQVDGSDCIKITAEGAVLEHKNFSFPSNVSVNGIPWDVRQMSALKNEGPTTFLPAGVDFSTARIISRKGRDLATAWAEKSALWVRFADNPNGSDSYEIVIAFGPEQDPP